MLKTVFALALLCATPALCVRTNEVTNVAFRVEQATRPVVTTAFLDAIASAAGLPTISSGIAYVNATAVTADMGDRDTEDALAEDNDQWVFGASVWGHLSDATVTRDVTSAQAADAIKASLASQTSALRVTYKVRAFEIGTLTVGQGCSQLLCRSSEVCLDSQCQFGDEETGLSHDEKAGIAVGVIAFVLIVLVAICSVIGSKNRKAAQEKEIIEAGSAMEAPAATGAPVIPASVSARGSAAAAKKASSRKSAPAPQVDDSSSSDGSSSSYFGSYSGSGTGSSSSSTASSS